MPLENKNNKNNWRDWLWLSSLGINLVLSITAGLLIGYYLDKWFSTRPVFVLSGFFVGVFAGFRQIMKGLKRLNEDESQKRRQ